VHHFGEEHARTAIYYNNLAISYNKLGDNENALKNYQKGLKVQIKHFG
jgi:hypothetical protein